MDNKELAMNKKELIAKIATHSDIELVDAERALNALISTVTAELSGRGNVSLVGFGTFSVKSFAARTGRNPKTGETLKIQSKQIPTFKAGSILKAAIN